MKLNSINTRFSVIITSLLSCSIAAASDTVFTKYADPPYKVINQHKFEISQLYDDLKIRKLDSIPESEYALLKRHIKDNTAYVVVHPAYYIFFQDHNSNKIIVDRGDDFTKNIVDIFLDKYPADGSRILKQIKQSIKSEKMFLSDKSWSEELVVLVLPPDYRGHPEYPYRKLDEFGRYLNEVTKGSRSVLYVESTDFKSGALTIDTINKLRRLFYVNQVTTVRIGGEYSNLCVSGTYDSISKIDFLRKIIIMTDICTISPDSIDE